MNPANQPTGARRGAPKSAKSSQNTRGGGRQGGKHQQGGGPGPRGRRGHQKSSPRKNGTSDENGASKEQKTPYELLENLVPVERPDKRKFDAHVRKLQDESKACQRTVDDCNGKQDEQQDIKRGHTRRREDAKGAFNKIVNEKRGVQNEVSRNAHKLRQHRDAIRKKESEAKKVRMGLKVDTEKKIEEEIWRIEHQLSTTSMSINREKALLKEIKTLKAQRGTAREYQKLRSDLETVRSPQDIDEIRREQRVQEARLEEIRRRESKQYELMRSHALLEKAVHDEIIDLVNKKRNARNRMRDIQIEIGEAQRQFRRETRKHESYIRTKATLERQCRTYDLYQKSMKKKEEFETQKKKLAEERRARDKKEEEEREQRRKQMEEQKRKQQEKLERKQQKRDEQKQKTTSKAEENDVEREEHIIVDPYLPKKVLCRSILGYLHSKLPSDSQTSSSKPSQDSSNHQPRTVERDSDAFVGLRPTQSLKRLGNNTETESLFGGSASHKKRRRRRRNKKQAHNTMVSHTPDVFGWFDKIGLDPPLQVKQVQESISDVEKQLKELEELSEQYMKSQTQQQSSSSQQREVPSKDQTDDRGVDDRVVDDSVVEESKSDEDSVASRKVQNTEANGAVEHTTNGDVEHTETSAATTVDSNGDDGSS